MKAVLVGLQLPGMDTQEVESSLQELKRLVETLGYEAIGSLSQKRGQPNPTTVVGSGKLRELALWTGGSGKVPVMKKARSKGSEKFHSHEATEEEDDDFDPTKVPQPTGKAGIVIFDIELTPNQIKAVEDATDAKVLDRTGVIVEIFSRHAKTRQARLQVEIARLKYLAPRQRVAGTGERQGGGVGGKGAGESSHELDRRRVKDRISELLKEIASIQEDQTNRRIRRKDQLRVALIGYTNAGKSSLMRALTGSRVLVADKLFATLDTTVRAMVPDTYPRILVSDTVGFIRKLPHDLVASFRSTLDEAAEASLLLYVVDASDPEFRSQLETTRQVISEIDASDVDSRIVLNKVDRLNIAETHLLQREFPNAIMISALNPPDVDRLKQAIRDFLGKDLETAEILIPFANQKGLMGDVRKLASVVKEEYDETGARLTIRSTPDSIARIKKMLGENDPAPAKKKKRKKAG